MSIAINLLFQSSNIRLLLNNFLLGISHIFVVIDLRIDTSDILLDRLAKLFQKLDAIVNELILSLIEAGDVGMNVVMVEECCAFLHFYLRAINIFITGHKNHYRALLVHTFYSLVTKRNVKL